MISASADFATAITAADREIRGYLKFNGTTVFRGADGLVSIQYNNALLDEERISVGCACSSYCVCEWYNNLTGVSLANSYFDAYVGVVESYAQTKPSGSIEDDTAVVEYIKLGRFYITDIERGKATTKVTAYDALSKASGQYTPTVVAGQSGYSVTDIINDIKTQTGITGTITGTAYVDTIYASTGREQLGWLCSVLYKDGSSFVIDRTTNDLTAVNFVKNTADLSIDDTTIYMDGVEDKPTFTVNSVEMGTESNTYTAGNGLGISRFNPYANQTIVDSIYSDVHGMAFVPMRLHFRGDPRIELGDLLSVTTDNNTYLVTVMKQTLTFNGGMECTIECFGNTEAHYIMSQSPTQAEFKRVDNAIADIAARIENPKNGIITTIKDADGYPTELLILNAMDKDDATSVWRFNINGLAHSTAYTGGTYSFALDDNGNINANLLRVGTITDANGYNSWDLNTGAFTITNGRVNIQTSSETDDIIQFNGSNLNAQGYGSTFSTQMQPLKFMVDGNFYTAASHQFGRAQMKVVDGNPPDSSITLWSGEYSNQNPSEYNYYTQTVIKSDSYRLFSKPPTEQSREILSLNKNGLTLKNASGVTTAQYLTTGAEYWNGSSTAMTALLRPDSNGAGRLMLGNGTDGTWRTELTNSGLTFRSNSNAVTANFPSDGMYFMDLTATSGLNSTTIVNLLNANNSSIPSLKLVVVRITYGGNQQLLLVNKLSNTYGGARCVGYFGIINSFDNFKLVNSTWEVITYNSAFSSGISWYQARDGASFRDISTPPNANGWWPALDMKSVNGDWSVGRIGDRFYISYVANSNYSSGTNAAARYYLPESTSAYIYQILTENTGALKPVHISGSTTTSFTANTYKYTGVSFTVPADRYFVVTAHAYYSSCSPSAVGISDSSTAINQGHLQIEHLADSLGTRARCTWTGYLSSQTTYYLWAKSTANGNLGIGVDGFYFA